MHPADHPFELLKLIRDGVIRNETQLQELLLDTSLPGITNPLPALQAAGLVTVSQGGDLTATKLLSQLLVSLRISLTRLEKYSVDESIVCNPIFGTPKRSARNPDIFVIMPFTDELRIVYEAYIAPIAGRLKMTIARGDDFFNSGPIIDDIWNAINDSDLVIADCTGRNPNVFYEMGIAHTLGKSVVLLSQNADDIPFDLGYIRNIRYNLTAPGLAYLSKTLTLVLEHAADQPRSLRGALLRANIRAPDPERHGNQADLDETRFGDNLRR